MNLQACLHSLLLPALLALAPTAATGDGLAWAELAEAYRARQGVQDVTPGEDPVAAFQTVLERGFCRARIGVFDVHYTRSLLTEEARAEELRGTCIALLDLQVAWIERFGNGQGEAKAAAADIAKLKKWLLKARVTKKALESPAVDFIAYFGGGAEEAALVGRIGDELVAQRGLGFTPRRQRPVQIAFAPTRRDFLELVAYIGWLDEPWRGTYWVDGATNWTEFYWNDLQVVGLEYPPVEAGADPFIGAAMNGEDGEETGLWQHVAQRGVHSLCNFAFDRSLDAAFEAGLAQELVAFLYGESNTRSGGNGRGSSRDGWSMFVPGGQSQGGWLPKLSADSHWREKKGADHYVEVLKLAQREGGKDARNARDKLPFFVIRHDDGIQRRTVRAPFLGGAARTKELPPAEYLGDYREFFRAYKGCFTYWLCEHAEGNAKKSRAKLAQLFERVAASVPAESGESSWRTEEEEEVDPDAFERILAEVYGRPWSAEEAEPASLEWEFLAWLAKQ
jgi:hypothetical protein